MWKKAWVAAIPLLVGVGCKSEKPFRSQGEEYGQQQPGAGQEPGAAQPGRTGRQPGTDGATGEHGGMMGGEHGGMMGTDHGGMMGGEHGGMMGQQGNRGASSASVRELRGYADKIRAASDMEHSNFVSALRTFSDAVEALPNAPVGAKDGISRIRSYADRIEASGATSNMHARWAKRALKEEADVLGVYAKDSKNPAFEARVDQVRAQVDQLAEDKPFIQQKENFAAVVEGLADGLAAMSQEPTQPATR